MEAEKKKMPTIKDGNISMYEAEDDNYNKYIVFRCSDGIAAVPKIYQGDINRDLQRKIDKLQHEKAQLQEKLDDLYRRMD